MFTFRRNSEVSAHLVCSLHYYISEMTAIIKGQRGINNDSFNDSKKKKSSLDYLSSDETFFKLHQTSDSGRRQDIIK